MGYCVFMVRPDSIYDDSPAERYQFPKQYLKRAEVAAGDWIVYLEPTKVLSTRGYFAIARVAQIVPDPGAPGMFLAMIEPGSYLPFAEAVAFNRDGGPIERGLLNDRGRLSGRAQAAVRPISAEDFLRILDLGFAEREAVLPRLDHEHPMPGLAEDQQPFEMEVDRLRIGQVTNRLVRDRSFRSIVLRAYGERCAFTGLKLINGGGRAEVDAAHIRPVAAGGPDIEQNGLALCGTAHWMFDRGLLGLSDDLEILLSRQINDVDAVRGLINPSGRARAPERARDRPHPRFLAWHREHCFKA